MHIREFSQPITVKALNENLAKKYGKTINVDKFTMEQLLDARNRLRTVLSQVETNESFDAVHTSETYQKNKLFLELLNTAIAEREVAEAKPDFLDLDKDGNKKEPIAYALEAGRHLGLPSPSLLPPHEPLIFPSGPKRTHFCLNHFFRSSCKSISSEKTRSPQFTQ